MVELLQPPGNSTVHVLQCVPASNVLFVVVERQSRAAGPADPRSAYGGGMSAKYRTEAVNRTGADGVASVAGGLSVTVSSPLDDDRDPTATNPEQLLALAWATCLNATAKVFEPERATAVRVEVELHPAQPGPGLEFRVDAYLSVAGRSEAETTHVLERAHARCPISKLIGSAATVRVHTEPYRSADLGD